MYYLGVDLGGTKIGAGIVDGDGQILLKGSVPTLSGGTWQEITRDMAALCQKLINESNIDIKDISSIGIGCPGVSDEKQGLIVYTANLGFRNAPVRAEMGRYLTLPVHIGNDANCAALAEYVAGAAKGTHSSMVITLGTGIGGGVIINGKIYSGFNGAAAEVGHTVIVSGGEPCTCGRRGCWERYASATACIRMAREAALKNPDSVINSLVEGDMSKLNAKTVFDAAKLGDKAAKEVVHYYVFYLAEGLKNMISSFMHEVIAIGGGVSREGEYLFEPLREMVYENVYGSGKIAITRIVAAALGNDAGIIGAAMLGRAG